MQYKRSCTATGSVQKIFVGVLLVLGGCTGTLSTRPTFVFPLQQVTETGDYRQFRADNEERLETCGREPEPLPVQPHGRRHAMPQQQTAERTECDEPLFNLGFVYAFPNSPYRDRKQALLYFHKLAEVYPNSPWAFPGRVWTVVIKEQEEGEESRRRLQHDLQRARTNLRSREKTIRTLQDQLKRLRELDIQMEKRQRDLLR